jgi:hypothetical protein
MNSALFIRRKSVLALWILTPLVLMSGMLVFSRNLLECRQTGFKQNQALAVLIPGMKAALDEFEHFATDYELNPKASRLSMEDRHILLFNAAAEKTGFVISAINLAQDDSKTTPQGITRIVLLVKGGGSAGEIAAFLNHIKHLDPLIYENQIQIEPDRSHHRTMQLEAEFGRVYLNTENCNAPVI